MDGKGRKEGEGAFSLKSISHGSIFIVNCDDDDGGGGGSLTRAVFGGGSLRVPTSKFELGNGRLASPRLASPRKEVG